MFGPCLYVADDYGLSEAGDEAIRDLAARGGVDAASLIVTGERALELRVLAARSVLLGLHLNLTRGRPLTAPHLVPSLVDSDGRFLSLGVLLRRSLSGRLSPHQLRLEVEAQWRRVEALCGRAHHLDGHQHVHLLPTVFAVVLALLRERHRQRVRVRFPRYVVGAGPYRSAAVMASTAWHRLATGLEPLPFDRLPTLADYRTTRRSRGRGVEIMMHVAVADDDALAGDVYRASERIEQYRRRLSELS